MVYLEFIGVVLWTVLRKVIGMMQVWYFVVVPFRAYARSVVHNYTLENGFACKRIMERSPEWDGNGWRLNGYEYKGGYIKYRKVSKLWYLIVKYVIWGWLDDDSRNDTYESKHTRTYLDGTRRIPLVHNLCEDTLVEEARNATGNSYFDMGDKRSEAACTGWLSQLIWNGRNAAYNFNYLDDTKPDNGKMFMHTIGKFRFGWEKDCGPVNGVQYYIRRIGMNW